MIWTQRPTETKFIKGMGTRATKIQAKMKCVNVQERIDIETDLSALKRDEKMWLHIELCRECGCVLNENLKIKTALKSAVKSEIVPNGLREKIQAALLKNV